jgi:hypothetical protein
MKALYFCARLPDMEASPIAELIVRNGRQQGAGRRLSGPVTIIGSTKGCDVRLNVDTVRPIHCFIALGPNGPHLRSWAPDDTFVNDSPVFNRVLCDGDVLRVGPFEFDIRWSAPLAEPAEGPPPVPSSTVAAAAPPESTNALVPVADDDKIRLVEDLYRQLTRARVDFRADKENREADFALQVRDLADIREELELREEETARQRSRLLDLRRRFVKRWKKHWNTQRTLISREVAQLETARSRFESEFVNFEEDRKRFCSHVQVEQGRIDYAWTQLRLAERNGRDERASQDAELDRRRRAVADEEARLKTLQDSSHAEWMALERRSADLRVEADGLESRIVNLRAVMLQLEEQRQTAGTESPKSDDSSSSPSRAESPTVKNGSDREQALVRRSEELDARHYALVEQANRLAAENESWRAEQLRIADELADLTEQVRRRENQIAGDEQAIAFEHQRLEQDQARFKQLCARSEAWRAKQTTVEATWRSELARRDIDLRLRTRNLERRENSLVELFRRWSERRRGEVEHLRSEIRRCQQLRSAWIAQQAILDQREQAIEKQQHHVETRALIVETARRKFLVSAGKPLLAEKRIERAGKQLARAQSTMNARLEQQRESVRAEREQLDSAFRHACEKIEQAVAEERRAAGALAQIEERELAIARRELIVSQMETVWKTHTEMYQRERADLRMEIERLAAVILDSDPNEPLPIAQAA